MQLQITIKGDKEIMKKLGKLDAASLQLHKPMRRIGRALADYYANAAFNSQGGVFGAKWPALSPITLLARGHNVTVGSEADALFGGFLIGRRLQSGSGGLLGSSGIQPLVDTGEMRDSFAYKSGASQVRIYNKAEYFKYHQSTAPRKRLPRRQMMGINDHAKGIINDHIDAHITGLIRNG